MHVEDFDLARYLRASRRIDLSSVAWERVPEHPLDGVEARCLTYMMDIESHTVVYLPDLLATRAILEPDVTTFVLLGLGGTVARGGFQPLPGRGRNSPGARE